MVMMETMQEDEKTLNEMSFIRFGMQKCVVWNSKQVNNRSNRKILIGNNVYYFIDGKVF
jgi:hypothetical protein